MRKILDIGRIFYGVAIAETGFQTIYTRDLPYMLLPPTRPGIPGFAALPFIFGLLFIAAGLSIVFKIKTRLLSLLLGAVLLLIFCFCFIPYEFSSSANFMHLAAWENAEKELALAGGAFAIALGFPGENENRMIRFLGKLAPYGDIIFSITIISFGILHFLYAKDAATLVPSWIPNHLFWAYFAGVALIGSGAAIILKIKTGLFAALLGTMILLWFISLHAPRVIAASPADRGGELTSAFIALAYSGIAFVVAGSGKKVVA